jgi:hypothetical protein
LRNEPFATPRALVVSEVLPEDEDVVGVAERDRVPVHVVDAPCHARLVEKIEDDRIIEDAVAPDAVRRDAA